jgi:hypothetical protein
LKWQRERERAAHQREGKSSCNVGGREREGGCEPAMSVEERESVEQERVEEEKK